MKLKTMNNNADFENIAKSIEEKLVEMDELKETLHKKSREIIKLSGQSIEDFHRKQKEKSKQKLAKTKNLISEIASILKQEIAPKNLGIVNVAMQEYVEARLFYDLVIEKTIPTPDELNVSVSAYLLGVADLIGELRRFILELLVSNNPNKAQEYYEIMKELYGTFLQIEIGKSIVSDFRRKKDTARVLVERTLSDLFVALQSKKLEDRLTEKNNID